MSPDQGEAIWIERLAVIRADIKQQVDDGREHLDGQFRLEVLARVCYLIAMLACHTRPEVLDGLEVLVGEDPQRWAEQEARVCRVACAFSEEIQAVREILMDMQPWLGTEQVAALLSAAFVGAQGTPRG